MITKLTFIKDKKGWIVYDSCGHQVRAATKESARATYYAMYGTTLPINNVDITKFNKLGDESNE